MVSQSLVHFDLLKVSAFILLSAGLMLVVGVWRGGLRADFSSGALWKALQVGVMLLGKCGWRAGHSDTVVPQTNNSLAAAAKV